MSNTTIKFEWHGDDVVRRVEDEAERRVQIAADYLRSETVRNLRAQQTRTVGPSAPGEIPHVDTGHLSKSIFTSMTGKTEAIVGTALAYGLFLEEGTSKMDARPFLSRTLAQCVDRIRSILTALME